MDVRTVFADNLRKLCDTRQSISAVCRDLSINRQQFARYLAGRSLPSQANLNKICGYFDVAEDALFAIDPATVTDGPLHGVHGVQGVQRRVARVLDQQTPARMPEGAYWVDYASLDVPDVVVRAVMLVRHEPGCTTFRRFTGRAERAGSWWGRFVGDHEGLVIERLGLYFFTAINTIGLQEPSMLVMRPAPGGAFMLEGTATIVATQGAVIMPAVMSPAPRSMSLRTLLKKARAYSVDAPDIPTSVIDMLAQANARLFTAPAGALKAR